ncbi:MAG: MmgE/PrpD family protein, partial [Planctomycetes bacterium]|nr:MmgE/PrpD family protein [Planctomycetota bacterium]
NFNEKQIRFMFSYVAQQTAGVACWMRDQSHVLKAFVFGGMPSRNGAFAAEMVANGFDGIEDVFVGKGNFLTTFSENPQAQLLTKDIGEEFAISTAAIKKWSVGSPIQAALDSLTALIAEHRLTADDVATLTVTMPDDRFVIVDNRDMPDVCLQHLLAVTLVDGGLTFATTHDHARMRDPAVLAVRERITAVPSAELTAARPARQAIIDIETRDGRNLHHRTRAVHGTPDNPMSQADVETKARDLLAPVLGNARADELVRMVHDLDERTPARRVAALLAR